MDQVKKKNVFANGDSDDDKKNRFKAGSIISMSAMLIGGIFQAAWISAVSRMLGDRDMGLYMPSVSLFYILGNLAAMGIPQTITTFVSHHYEKEFDEANKFLSDGFRMLLIISGGTFIATAITSFLLWKLSIVTPLMAAMAVIMSAAVSAIIVFWGANGILNGFQRLDLTAIGNMVYPVGVFGGSVGFIIVAQRLAGAESQWDVAGALGGMVVGHVIALLAVLLVIHKLGTVKVSSLFAVKGGHGLYGRILKFGGFAATCMVFVTILQQATPVIVRIIGMRYMLFGDTPEACESAIGHFSTALFYGQVAMLLVGIAIAVMPAISEAESQGRHDMMQHYYSTALHQAFIVLTAFAVFYIAYVGVIIEAMSGPEFPASLMHNLGVLSLAGGAAASLLFVIMNLFMGLKKPYVPAIVMGCVIILLIISTAVFSFIFRDINWAFGGFVFSTWAGAIILIAAAKKMFGLSVEPWTFLEPIASAIPCLLIFFFVVPETKSIWMLINMVIMLGAYGFLVWLFDKRRTNKAIPAAL